MENKKGFAIIETLITTVILTTALISLYVLFNNIMIKEKRRVYYDDPIFVARSNYIFDALFKVLREPLKDNNIHHVLDRPLHKVLMFLFLLDS